jgi:hypothetical protein
MSKYEFEDGGHGDFLGSTNENLVDDDDDKTTPPPILVSSSLNKIDLTDPFEFNLDDDDELDKKPPASNNNNNHDSVVDLLGDDDDTRNEMCKHGALTGWTCVALF